jgi:hypothetical protein
MNRVLLAGAGGGYDLIGAIPLLVELREAGKTVHLASLTFTDYSTLPITRVHPVLPNLASVTGSAASRDHYCPEAWLSLWLSENLAYSEPVWLFDKTGVVPLRRAYEALVRDLNLDAIVLVDGGVDAILRGDETSIGTPGEDLTSLAAVSGLAPATFLACLGMSSELRDGICHAQFLQRVSELSRQGAFLGTATLSLLTEAGRAYERAFEFIIQNQAGLRQSHVQRVVLAAMRGQFGAEGIHTWLSPLLSLYWFFSLPAVVATHLFLPSLEGTNTAWEVSAIVEGVRKNLTIQETTRIPI